MSNGSWGLEHYGKWIVDACMYSLLKAEWTGKS